MARILCGPLLLLALAAGTLNAAPSTLDVQGRSYVVVGACEQPAYSIRLPLGPPPGRDSMDALSVLFGADAAGHGYRFDADARGWTLLSRTVGGTRRLAAGRESPLPAAGPLELLVKRRDWLLTVAVDGRVLAEVADADHFAGRLAVDPSLSGPAGEPSVQAVSQLLFEDTFMRPEDDASLGQWAVRGGTWRIHSVREDVDDMNVAGRRRGKQPESGRSANPFCVSASADQEGLLTTGYWFWDDLEAEVALRNDGVPAAGLAFNVTGPDDLFLLRWENEADALQPTAIRLLRVKGGQRHELASAWVDGQRGQWYRLAVRTCGRRIRAYLDEALIIDAQSDECLGGRFGLYVQGGDKDHEAVFDDVRVRSIRAYDYDDPVWIEHHVAAREGRWNSQEAPRPARPAGWAAVLRDRDGRLTMGHDAWPPARVSASVTAPASGQAVGFDLALKAEGASSLRVVLSCDEQGRRLSVRRVEDGRQEELASCRDLPLPASSRMALAADLTRPGELNVYAGGRLCLHLPREGGGGGAVGVFATGLWGAEFHDLRVAFERDEDQERLPAIETFRDDPFMKHWSSPEGAWWPVEGRDDAWWHVGDFYGRSEIELPLNGRTSVSHCATDASQDSGYCLVQEKVQPADAAAGREGLRLRLLRLGREVAAADLAPEDARPSRCVLYRDGPYLWVTVDGREVLSFRDPEPLPGRKVALAGIKEPELAKLKLRRFQVKDYYFEGAPVDWYRVGNWKVTTRFSCDPRWSFMTAIATQNAVLFNKYVYSGDLTLEAHMGSRMGTPDRGGRYWRVGDFNLALCARPGRLDSGYNFIVAGWDRCWSDRGTYLLKGLQRLAYTSERFLPNVRRQDTQERVLPVPWIRGGRPIHGAWYYIKARKQGGELTSYVDNHPAYTYTDPEPLERFSPAVWTYDTQVVVARVKVSYEKREVPGRLVEPPAAEPEPRPAAVPAPVLVSESHPGFFDGFEGGQRGWHTYAGQQGSVLHLVADSGASGRHCLRVTNPGGGGLFEAIAPVGDARIRAAEARTVGFRYRIPPGVLINLHFKIDGQYYYVHLTGPDEESSFYKRLGELPVQADDRWHEAQFPLAAAYRDAGGAAGGLVESVVFGNLHRGLLQAGIGGNGPGLSYSIDDFKVVSAGPSDFQAACRPADVPDGAAVLGCVDPWTATVPGGEKPLARQALTDGEWFCHARVRGPDGALSAVAHLPFLVAARPLAVTAVEPGDGRPWGYGPIEVQFGAERSAFLDADTLRLHVNGQAVEAHPGLFHMDWVAGRLRIDLAGAGLQIGDGEPCALDLSYADEAGQSGSFSTSLIASVAQDATPPTPVALDGYLPVHDFEDDAAGWEGSRDTALLRDATTAASGRYSLKVQNLRWGSAFTAFVRKDGLDAGAYPLVEFDYNAPEGVQFDLVASNPRGYATVGLSDGCRYGTYVGEVADFTTDGRWHHCEFNLLDGLRKVPYTRGVFRQRWLALGDFGYRANAVGACYNVDNVRFVPLASGRRALALKWRAHDAGGVRGYSYKWSSLPDDSPDDEIDTDQAGGTFTDLPTPDAYLHVKACDRAGNWGPVRSFRFRVDGDLPRLARATPEPGARSADSTISVVVQDDGSAVDPDALVLTVDGRAHRPHNRGIRYDPQTGELTWNWVKCRPQDQRGIPDGAPVHVELAAADFAGNALPTRRWQWVMDYSLDREAPTVPALSSTSVVVGEMQDFEEGVGRWRNQRGDQSGAQLKRVPRNDEGSDHCLELSAARDKAFFDAVASERNYDLAQQPLVCFDYRMPKPVAVNMQVRVNNTWFEVKMTGSKTAHREIGGVPDVTADGQWHHVCLDLLELVRKAAPGAERYTVNSIGFGDPARNGNPKDARWFVDNFMVGGYGRPDAEFAWRSEDITGVAGYAVVFDRQMGTIPPREGATEQESGRFSAEEPGTYWLHVAADDGNGNWSRPRHLAYHVVAAPVPQPDAQAP